MLKEKIGQMLLMGFPGTELSSEDPIVKAIRARQVGGVILFANNIQNPDQLRRLTQQLQDYANSPSFLIGIDYEGGTVNRLNEENGFPPTLSAAQVSELSLKEAEDHAIAMANTLKQAGINLNFAPVLDVNVNANNPIIGKRGRSFSDDPKKVAVYAGIFAKTFQENGIVCAYKHFPGHGSSIGDTHTDFVEVTDSWKECELEPYQKLLPLTQEAAMVMTAHVVHAGLDKQKHPASLSTAITTHLLRHQLQYDGVVITDDLQMKAIADHYGLTEAVRLAINAGADMLIFGNQLSNRLQTPSELVEVIHQEVLDGRVTEERVEKSYQRILKLKGHIFNTPFHS